MKAAIGSSVLLAFLAPGNANAAPPNASGDPATIAFYRTVVTATAHEAGWKEVLKGFDYLNQSSTSWYGGTGTAPTGYTPVADHLVAAASAGHLVWLSDQLERPSTCRPTKAGNCAALLVLLDSAGLFVHSLAPGSPSCWYRGSGSIAGYTKVGPTVTSGYSLLGHFQPMRRAGTKVYVTSTYPYGKFQHASEVDTISYASRLPSASVVRLAAAPGYPAKTFSSTLQWLHSQPAKPVFTVCP